MKETAARDTWEAASSALAKVRELLDAGKTADAQRAALTMAIALDKSLVLESAAAAGQERRARINEQIGRDIVQLLEEFLGALGIPFSTPVRKLLAAMLRQGALFKAAAAEAEAARADVRRVFAAS